MVGRVTLGYVTTELSQLSQGSWLVIRKCTDCYPTRHWILSLTFTTCSGDRTISHYLAIPLFLHDRPVNKFFHECFNYLAWPGLKFMRTRLWRDPPLGRTLCVLSVVYHSDLVSLVVINSCVMKRGCKIETR